MRVRVKRLLRREVANHAFAGVGYAEVDVCAGDGDDGGDSGAVAGTAFGEVGEGIGELVVEICFWGRVLEGNAERGLGGSALRGSAAVLGEKMALLSNYRKYGVHAHAVYILCHFPPR